ncbi:MAG: EVE domain-containing protein [Anaerolineae bacterium]
MSYWIFKTNPEQYRIDERLQDPNPTTTWSVTRYKREIRKDDVAFIWRTGNRRGICAVMRIDTDPKEMAEIESEQKYQVKRDGAIKTRVLGTLTHRLVPNHIPAEDLKKDVQFKNLPVFHGYQAMTNFKIEDSEAKALLELISRKHLQ